MASAVHGSEQQYLYNVRPMKVMMSSSRQPASKSTSSPRQPPKSDSHFGPTINGTEHQSRLSNPLELPKKVAKSLALCETQSNSVVGSDEKVAFASSEATEFATSTATKDDLSSSQVVLDTISLFKRLADGQEHNYSDTSIPITRKEFKNVKVKVQEDDRLRGWLEDKARYEYDPQAEKLFIRCPTAQHESIVSSLTFRITSEVESRSTHSDTSEHARKIWRRLRSISTSDIKLTDNEGNSFNLQPDISFILKETQTPSFITEVAYSQIERDLAKRAETLIQTSRGDVSTVMGIKIQYPEAKNASLTIWKANFEVIDNEDALTTDQVLGPVHFIINSQFVPGEDVRLSIENFAGPDELEDIPDEDRTDSITIPLRFFYDIAMEAKEIQEDMRKPKRKREGDPLHLGSKVRPKSFGYRGIRLLSVQSQPKT